MNYGIVKGKSLPDYVFTNQYKHFLFVPFSEIFCNQIFDFIKVMYPVLKEGGSKELYVYDLSETKAVLRRTFPLHSSNEGEIAEYFKEYKESGFSYYPTIAYKIVLVDDTQTFCMYAGKDYDICIIACTGDNFIRLKKKQTNLYFKDLDEFLEYLSVISSPERFIMYADKFRKNYSSG